MPEFYIDKDGHFHYANEGDFFRYSPTPTIRPTSWDPYVVSYYKSLYGIRQLPISPIESPDFVRSQRGYIDLSKGVLSLQSEQNVFGKQKPGYHEKSWPTRIGIPDEHGKVISHYFRSFDMSAGMKDATSKIISNVVCGRLFPTKMPYYIGRYNNEFGTIGIDLNHIEGVKSLRLDKYLESKGIDLNSVTSLMQAYKTGVFKEDLTNSAIAQLVFGMFSLPNAIGEQDPNTRNAILLGPDKKGEKFDSIVRIDFENNRINNSPNQSGTATREGDGVRVYPFGIYGRDENKFEFKENIIKALVDKQLTPEDANLILSVHKVTKYATASRTNIDLAVTEASDAHKPVDEQGFKTPVKEGMFTTDEIETFAEDVIKRAENYTDNIQKYFSEAADKAHISLQKDATNLPPLTPEE